MEFPTGDYEYQETTIDKVRAAGPSHWEVKRSNGWSMMLERGDYPEPKAGMTFRSYGKGIGSVVRGVFIDCHKVYYRTEAEDEQHHNETMYGKDAAEWLRRWDAGKTVWSVQMGGLGPGYEQAIHIIAAEVLRYMLLVKPDLHHTDDERWRAWGDEVSDAVMSQPPVKELGCTGAQWGAANNIAACIYNRGPIAALTDKSVKDRLIQVENNIRFAEPTPAA